MLPLSRRNFLALPALALRRVEPELVLYNANFLTMDPRNPSAEAVAISGGRLLFVGSNAEVRNAARLATKQVDLGGRTVTPGFIDAHTHPSYSGLRHLRWVDTDLRSIAAIQKALADRAAKTKPGEWVLGFKYDDTKTSDGRRLRKQDLDDAAANHPVYVEHRGGHTAYVNSLALKLAGLTDSSPDPAGGQLERVDGHLTGCLRERATEPFWKLLPTQYTRQERQEAVRLIAKMMTRTGVTSVHDAEGTPDDLRAYQEAFEPGQGLFRVYCFIQYPDIAKLIEAGVRTGLGDDWVRVGGCKLVADGSISERTARLSKPYLGRPTDFGILVRNEAELYEQAKTAHLAGWQLGTHTNGDVAIDLMLRVYERLQKEYPKRDPRYRLEHCTVVNPDLIARMKRQGVIPTPFSTYVYYHGEKMKEYGSDRLNWMFALRSFLDAGIPATQASDYPPGPFEPMMALQSEVTRTSISGTVWGQSQRITVEEAIRVGTVNGAYAGFDEHRKGSIEAGKLADLVVLGKDPREVDPHELIKIPVERTMVGGRWVHES